MFFLYLPLFVFAQSGDDVLEIELEPDKLINHMVFNGNVLKRLDHKAFRIEADTFRIIKHMENVESTLKSLSADLERIQRDDQRLQIEIVVTSIPIICLLITILKIIAKNHNFYNLRREEMRRKKIVRRLDL